MSRCMHCGIDMPGDYSFCSACEWIHLGLRPEVESKLVARARIILEMFNQHYSVSDATTVHQLMVDLMVGCDTEDEELMQCVGWLRKILEKAVDDELAERGYTPQGEPL